MTAETLQQTRPAMWRRVIAAILDFLTTFIGFGFLVAYFFGGLTEKGFQLTGGPALLPFGPIVAHFVIFNKFLGGTIWKHILGARTS